MGNRQWFENLDKGEIWSI